MMNNNGLYIKEFEARGENVSTSKLTFQKGCNVVLGKSDTGKTTLYSIIEFVLGKGSIDLTLPPETTKRKILKISFGRLWNCRMYLMC